MNSIPIRIKNLILRKTLFKISERPVLMDYESEQELRMRCKYYSERDSILEKILFELNKRGLQTFVCCKGHSGICGYVGFKVPESEEDFVNQLCTRLLRETQASIYIHEKATVFRGTSVAIYFSGQDKEEVLPFLLECIQRPNQEYSEYMKEAFKLCRIQESIHDDLIYGFHFYPSKDGLLVSPNNQFLYFSLERRISLNQLFRFCMYLDDFTKKIKGKIVKEEELGALIQMLNINLLKIVESPSLEPVDHYVNMSEEEIVKLMETVGFYPGYLEDLITKNQNRTIKKEEIFHISEFNTEEGLYLFLLKLEESLAVKRKNALQEKKYML